MIEQTEIYQVRQYTQKLFREDTKRFVDQNDYTHFFELFYQISSAIHPFSALLFSQLALLSKQESIYDPLEAYIFGKLCRQRGLSEEDTLNAYLECSENADTHYEDRQARLDDVYNMIAALLGENRIELLEELCDTFWQVFGVVERRITDFVSLGFHSSYS